MLNSSGKAKMTLKVIRESYMSSLYFYIMITFSNKTIERQEGGQCCSLEVNSDSVTINILLCPQDTN